MYTPMQPHAPIIRARGEGETQLDIQLTGRTEVKAAYSPINHILVLGAVTGRPGKGIDQGSKQEKYRTLQYELGIGAYLALGDSWVVQTTIGTGAARTQRTLSEFGILLAFNNDYDARYRKKYGQVGLAYQAPRRSLGLGYRLTQVHFLKLSAQDRQTPFTRYQLPLDKQLRHEFYLFGRYYIGENNRWQLQASMAYSATFPGRGLVDPYTEIAQRARFNRGASLLTGLGIVFYPSQLRQRAAFSQ
ncbi:hypothetical protein KLP40_09570 [Hymenobacter sp. NST-14]|uniref:hypothetical protein n=1 Tax=Hymenobacter piscis TaxID=2839984 RepID=UPI001C015C86|nr:hypothetical protein [Hymenobacter piscis]MBT9393411.1 hypothetical protein [Hymenobacter piscis]